MDLSTTYLGLHLKHPLMPGASPLVEDMDKVRRMEDSGAAAIVMYSLFEEQLTAEERDAEANVDAHTDSYGEATSFLPHPDHFRLGPEDYLEQLRRIKDAVKVPVIGSLNGSSRGGWVDYARLIEEAGADALELNTYSLVTDPHLSSTAVEKEVVDLVQEVKKTVRIPVAVKLSPRYSALPHFVRQLELAGADGTILFNRFYQADIDVEELEVVRKLQLSNSSELLMRLRWLAILSGQVKSSLAITGGVHTAIDAVKAVMAGAHVVQMVSALLMQGPMHLQRVIKNMKTWMEEHEYESIAQMRGSMSHSKCPNPKAFERLNYIEILKSWQ